MRGVWLAIGLIATMATAQAQEPRWQYGRHPVLGPSAHVVLPSGAYVGLVCGRRSGAAVRMIFSPGFFPADYVARNPASPVPGLARFVTSYAFAGAPSHGGEMLTVGQNGQLERAGTSCDVDIDALRRARAIWYFDQDAYEPAHRAEAGEGDPPPDIAERIARRAQVRLTLPLTGAREAIDRLIALCRPLAEDIRNQCGI
jgi:hypothetical protein